jgi:hypothetical protein
MELWEPVVPMLREKHKWLKPRGESTDAEHWGGPTCTSVEGCVMRLEQRGRVKWLCLTSNWRQEETPDAMRPSAVRQVCVLDGSGVNREVHAPFCERPEVKFLRPTHHGLHWTLDGVPQRHGKEVQYELTDYVEAIRKMRAGPSESAFRRRLQTTPSCCA